MPGKTDKPIKNFLMDFGLTEKEISLYLTLLKTGPNTIMNLARETGIKRSTTHNNIEELIKKGLVSQTNYGERRMVIAEDPGKLEFLLEQKKWGMKKLEDNLYNVVKMINESVPNAARKNKVEVKYYEGEKGFKEVCQRSLDYSKGEVLFISNPDEFKKVGIDKFDENFYIPYRLRKNIKVKALLTHSPEAESIRQFDEKQMRETKFLEGIALFKSTLMIYGDEVSIMASKEPNLSIVISSEEIATTFKNLFEALWSYSK